MSHLSESNFKLEIVKKDSLVTQSSSIKDVWFIKYPYYQNNENIPDMQDTIFKLNSFIDKLESNTTIAILSSPKFIANVLSELTQTAYFKLWIGVKLKEVINSSSSLPQKHASLAIITKYKGPLQHTKTRISYTFCPFCEKTTKDYGGKKHLYHEYGTLMSDVWRDIEIDYNDISLVTERLRDLFSILPYKFLNFVDLSIKEKCYISAINNIIDNNLVSPFNYLGNNSSTIINGDCLDILKKIPSNSIDFCFADPPYNVNKKYENWNDSIDIKEYFDWCNSWLSELARVIKPGKTVAVLNIPQWSIRHFKHLNKILKFQDWIIWDSLSVPVRMIMPAHYSIICFTKSHPNKLPFYENNIRENINLTTSKEFYCIRNSCIKKRNKEGINYKENITNIWWDIHRLKHNSSRVDHPTQLPPSLMYRLISTYTKEGDVILDPFNGSGTTTLCAQQMKRKYFGIELSKKYYDISITRHAELDKNIDPFGRRNAIPQSKNSNVNRLRKQKYEIDKKTLQLEVKKIAQKLKKIPSRDEVVKYSQYPIRFFDEYFISWGEVTAAARTTGMKDVENKSKYEQLINQDYHTKDTSSS